MVQTIANDKPEAPAKARRIGRWKLFAVLMVCASPLIASYLTYYVIKPSGRTNYGDLIDPRQYPIPALGSTSLEGEPRTLQQFSGKWIMLKVGGGACLEACKEQLLEMRQWRLMQGKNMSRIERVWLLTDAQAPDAAALRNYKGADLLEGQHLLRASPDAVAKWLPVDKGTSASDHIFLIDPLGNLMMRFPKDPERRRVYKDISKLLKASAIG